MSTMRARVLGSAGGGGLPHWNCACPNCELARGGDARVRARTQDALAVFARDDAAVLCNASPDLPRQLAAAPVAAIASIVLTNSDLDQALGLLALRDSRPLAVYTTDAIRRVLVELVRFPANIEWRELVLDRETKVGDGITARAFPLLGKRPKTPQDNIGLELRGGARTIVYAPRAGFPPHGLGNGADVLLFDGTFWSNDELIRLDLGSDRARDLAHAPLGGLEGTLALLSRCTARRKVFTHINHTNPMLALDSRERLAVLAAGWDIAEDGMDLA
jgi:pyrroloquinoline quinone biosynthesis protein B